MSSRPLQIAFTALTLSLVISMSMWVLHTSHEYMQLADGVTLQMSTGPAIIDSDQVQRDLRPHSLADPFSEDVVTGPAVAVEIHRIETMPVAQNFPHDVPVVVTQRSPHPEQIAQLPQFPEESLEPLELPPIDLTQEPFTLEEQSTQTPAPAWLSVQATLEAEIDELRQELKASMKAQQGATQQWQARHNQLQQDLNASRTDGELLKSTMAGLRSETESLQSEIDQKTKIIDQLESELKATRQQPSGIQLEMPQILDSLSEPLVPHYSSSKSTQKNYTENRTAENKEADSQEPKAQPTFNDGWAQTAELPNRNIVPELVGQTAPPVPSPALLKSEPQEPQVLQQPLIPFEPVVDLEPTSTPETIETDSISRTAAEPFNPHRDCEPRKKGLIYDLKDWFHDFRHKSDSCTDTDPLCTETSSCTETSCTQTEFDEPACGCPKCAAKNAWIQEDQMLSYRGSQDRSTEKSHAGLVFKVKHWWQHRKYERDVRYEPPVIDQPAGVVVLPAAYVE